MVRSGDRSNLQTLSLILLVGALFAYGYTRTETLLYGMTYTTAPFRQYAQYLAILGIVGIMLSFVVPINNDRPILQNAGLNVSFCTKYGKQIPRGVRFCTYCGKEQV